MLVTTPNKKEKTMAKKNDTTFFENKLLVFVAAKDPMLEMFQWVMNKCYPQERVPYTRLGF